jgi:hypothetical protein
VTTPTSYSTANGLHLHLRLIFSEFYLQIPTYFHEFGSFYFLFFKFNSCFEDTEEIFLECDNNIGLEHCRSHPGSELDFRPMPIAEETQLKE